LFAVSSFPYLARLKNNSLQENSTYLTLLLSENNLTSSLYLNAIRSLRLIKLFCQVGFEVLTAVSTKMAVFWVTAQCSLVEVYQRFRGLCCLHQQAPDDGGSKDL
jgi:hypothetical protein